MSTEVQVEIDREQKLFNTMIQLVMSGVVATFGLLLSIFSVAKYMLLWISGTVGVLDGWMNILFMAITVGAAGYFIKNHYSFLMLNNTN